MNLLKLISLTGIVLSINLFAGEIDKNEKDLGSIANFYYKQGYQAGYKQGYEEGYQKALNYAKEKLKEYALKIKAYEAGKYLIATKKITYPQVFYIKNPDNSIKIVIKNSQIEKEIGADDILYIPNINLSNLKNINDTIKPSYEVSNSVSTQDIQTNPEVPKLSKNTLNAYYLYMPNTESYKNILNKAGLVYAETGNRLKVIFQSKKEAQNFIKDFGLVKNIDYFTKD